MFARAQAQHDSQQATNKAHVRHAHAQLADNIRRQRWPPLLKHGAFNADLPSTTGACHCHRGPLQQQQALLTSSAAPGQWEPQHQAQLLLQPP